LVPPATPLQLNSACDASTETCVCTLARREVPQPTSISVVGWYPSTAIVVCCSRSNNSRLSANCNEKKSLASRIIPGPTNYYYLTNNALRTCQVPSHYLE
jgi:hypothetical protein